MTYARSKPAMLREFGRTQRGIREAERTLDRLKEKRNALLLANDRSPEKATAGEIGTAAGEGFGESAVRMAMKRMRDTL